MSLKRYKEGIDVLKEITYSYLQPRRHDTTREVIDSLTNDEFQWSSHLFLSFGYRSMNSLQESSQEINEMWKVTHQFVNTKKTEEQEKKSVKKFRSQFFLSILGVVFWSEYE
jgi:hypothetical protein